MIDERPVIFSKAALVSGAVSINVCPAVWKAGTTKLQGYIYSTEEAAKAVQGSIFSIRRIKIYHSF